jgi:hypothetical protein
LRIAGSVQELSEGQRRELAMLFFHNVYEVTEFTLQRSIVSQVYLDQSAQVRSRINIHGENVQTTGVAFGMIVGDFNIHGQGNVALIQLHD